MRIIYLHGFASGPSSTKAEAFRSRFAELGISVEVPDLGGEDFEHLTITSQIRTLESIANGDAVSLVGSSMGGYLAALYASQHDEVQKLVLMAPAFHFPHRWEEELGPERAARWKQTGTLSVYHYAWSREALIGYGLVEDARRYHPMPSVTQPALIFHGINDETVPVRFSQEYAARHANVRLRILESDHQLTDSIELIWRESVSFLLGNRVIE
jgi:pimeloyl-ACP methyl ester carboxylesterase